MGLPAGLVEQAILLAIGCHDLGKLDNTWQQWALQWQTSRYERDRREVYERRFPNFCFAKTDNDNTKEDKALQKEVRPKRPPHSCESVVIGRSLIRASLGINKTEGKGSSECLCCEPFVELLRVIIHHRQVHMAHSN